ncbi:geranylgeranylglyceryl/heptaprenylglyceryl phosphate synthase [Aestuariivivens marinum]|uniref:geranylgeranylglyceryl/heptaprenylglyceryl phosphate synthase n=1 Tax=Aestuariivivens marinum TaxID=2913555 RepID=UPI001F599EFC|nr:geranylgeranylglyceryl/heptaprenylglyceryl phosphate synthase [Aestuariivivens marinum]
MAVKQSIYQNILKSITANKQLLAVLIDPDKFSVENTEAFIERINQSVATHIFVGGSFVEEHATSNLVETIKMHTSLPVVLFPGDVTQICENADALLFLSLISGRNPDYLIGKHVEAVSALRKKELEVISTGYILIENGKTTAVERVTKTKPMSRKDIQNIVDTAKAGEYLGMKLMYLEAGSGAKHPVTPKIIQAVKKELNLPLIVGGGIRAKQQLEIAYSAGANMVVIGTAFEDDESFFDELKYE